MHHEHEAKIYPPECTRAAAHLRKLKGHDNPSKLIIAEAEDALTRAALELHFLETFMRTAQKTLVDLLEDDKAQRAESAAKDATIAAKDQALADAAEANGEFQTALADLQKKYDDLVANPPVANPDDVIAADDPARIEANTLLDGNAPANS